MKFYGVKRYVKYASEIDGNTYIIDTAVNPHHGFGEVYKKDQNRCLYRGDVTYNGKIGEWLMLGEILAETDNIVPDKKTLDGGEQPAVGPEKEA